MANTIKCATHGQGEEAYVCIHLVGETAGLGFNRDEPTSDNPFPDAWCDDCELIYAAHHGWNEKSEKLLKISLLCSNCYERARIRNTRTSVTFDDLAGLRWKCSSCEQWHTGPCLDFSFDAPYYWRKEDDTARLLVGFLPGWVKKRPETFLDDDYCAIDDRDFFVRGLIHLPILGAAETFRWGVWGSLSRENFETLLKMHKDSARANLPSMFSWLSTQIPEYPETLSLKMHASIQPPGLCPHFVLEPTDHPLSRQYYQGISAEQVREIMLSRLRDAK